jgi:hypothetical protein
VPVIPALRRLGLEDHELEDSLGYIARPCLKRKEEKREGREGKKEKKEKEKSKKGK